MSDIANWSLAQWPFDILSLVIEYLDAEDILFKLSLAGNKQLRRRLEGDARPKYLTANQLSCYNPNCLLPFVTGLRSICIRSEYSYEQGFHPDWLLALPPTLESIDFQFTQAIVIWIRKPTEPTYAGFRSPCGHTPQSLTDLFPRLQHLRLTGRSLTRLRLPRFGLDVLWSIPMFSWFAAHLPRQLKTLEMGPVHMDSRWCRFLPALESLMLKGYLKEGHISSAMRDNLQRLYIDESDLRIEHLNKYPRLEYLGITLNSNQMQASQLPPHLKSLQLVIMTHNYIATNFTMLPNSLTSLHLELEFPLGNGLLKTLAALPLTNLSITAYKTTSDWPPRPEAFSPNLRILCLTIGAPDHLQDLFWLPRTLTSLNFQYSALQVDQLIGLPSSLTHLQTAGDPFTPLFEPSASTQLQASTTSPISDTIKSSENSLILTSSPAESSIFPPGLRSYEHSESGFSFSFSRMIAYLPKSITKLNIDMSGGPTDVELAECRCTHPLLTEISCQELLITGKTLPRDMTRLSSGSLGLWLAGDVSPMRVVGASHIIEVRDFQDLPPNLTSIDVNILASAHFRSPQSSPIDMSPLRNLTSLRIRNGSLIKSRVSAFPPKLTQLEIIHIPYSTWWPSDHKQQTLLPLSLERITLGLTSPFELKGCKALFDNFKPLSCLTYLSLDMSTHSTTVFIQRAAVDLLQYVPPSITWLKILMSSTDKAIPNDCGFSFPNIKHFDAPVTIQWEFLSQFLPKVEELGSVGVMVPTTSKILGRLSKNMTTFNQLALVQSLLPSVVRFCSPVNINWTEFSSMDASLLPKELVTLDLGDLSITLTSLISSHLAPSITELLMPSGTLVLQTKLPPTLTRLVVKSMSGELFSTLPRGLTSLTAKNVYGSMNSDTIATLPLGLTTLHLHDMPLDGESVCRLPPNITSISCLFSWADSYGVAPVTIRDSTKTPPEAPKWPSSVIEYHMPYKFEFHGLIMDWIPWHVRLLPESSLVVGLNASYTRWMRDHTADLMNMEMPK